MHHSSSRNFYIAPRPLIIRRNTPFYVWYITSLRWNIRWKTRPHVNILLIGVWISVEPVLVLIHNFSVIEYQTKHSPHVSYMSCLWGYGILEEILTFVLIYLLSVLWCHIPKKFLIISWCLDIRQNTPSRHWFLISRPRMKDETAFQCLCLVRVLQIATASAKKTLKLKLRIENASVYNHWEHTPRSYFSWLIPLHSTEISNICWIILTKMILLTHLVSISR